MGTRKGGPKAEVERDSLTRNGGLERGGEKGERGIGKEGRKGNRLSGEERCTVRL